MSFRWPVKDPDEQLDYSVDWSRFLVGATISSVVWHVKSNTYSTKTVLAAGEDLTTASTGPTAIVNGATSSTTTLVVDNNVSTIVEGMTVAGTGISGSVTVASLSDQNNLVLSSAQTLANDVTLFFDAGAIDSIQNVSQTNTPTVATINIGGGTNNAEYTFFCRMIDSTGSQAERSIKLRIKER
tara:strand:- start:16 stop:567 length:552 start_codon:yes stop_codon:yes gene_type:complete